MEKTRFNSKYLHKMTKFYKEIEKLCDFPLEKSIFEYVKWLEI